MIKFSEEELPLVQKLRLLKKDAGSHAPGIFTIRQNIPEISVKVDACFLSNPYATDLFIRCFEEEVLETGKMRELLGYYPSQNAAIAQFLSGFLRLPAASIFIGNGATEIIQAVFHHFPVYRVMINIPTFSPYYEFVREGVEVIYHQLLKEEQYNLNINRYIEGVKYHQPDTLVLVNPNNPNGGYTRIADLELLLNALSFVQHIIVDESFIHFAWESEAYQLLSFAHLTEAYPNLIVIKSMSKDFGIAGIRAGYGVMKQEWVSALLRNGYLWNSNGLAEYFFRLYTQTDFAAGYEKVRKQYITDTLHFIQELALLPHLKLYPSMANFVLIELLNGLRAAELVAKLLLGYGIYIRTCEDKIGLDGEFIRIASRTKAENNYVIQSLKACLERCTSLELMNESAD